MLATWSDHRNRVAAPTLSDAVRFASHNMLSEITYYAYEDGPGVRYAVSPEGQYRSLGVDSTPVSPFAMGWR
jgi:hypothetical protein